MQKTILFKNPFFLFIVMLLFIASCNNNDSAAAKTDGEDTTDKTDKSVADSNSPMLDEKLNILSMLASDFPKNGNRITFRFYDELNSLTLHGWLGVNFNDDPPAIRLNLASKSTVKLGTGNYLGNLILKEPQVNEVNRLKGSYNFILYIPEIDTSGNSRGSIVYRISFTNTVPSLFTNISPNDLSTDITTNPSPPRNSQ